MTPRELRQKYWTRRAPAEPEPRDPEIVSEYVAALTADDAQRAAKALLIEAGHAPDYPVITEPQGDGTWEVAFTVRPMTPGSGYFASGQRYSNVGARA